MSDKHTAWPARRDRELWALLWLFKFSKALWKKHKCLKSAQIFLLKAVQTLYDTHTGTTMSGKVILKHALWLISLSNSEVKSTIFSLERHLETPNIHETYTVWSLWLFNPLPGVTHICLGLWESIRQNLCVRWLHMFVFLKYWPRWWVCHVALNNTEHEEHPKVSW